MKINEIIREKRKLENLTQEQLAEKLGVSAPAVNKWEKGSCYPDITLLPRLARILKCDLNTLLSFKDDLTDKEVGDFANELAKIIGEEGFSVGFNIATDKIQEYQTSDKLILTVATILQGSLVMYDVKEKERYENYIEELYIKVSNSEDISLKNSAISLLISKYLGAKDYIKAQEYIDKLQDITYDKKQLQGNLYLNSKEYEKAAKLFEGKLLSTANDIMINLTSLIQIALKENRDSDALDYAKVLEDTTKLYDLWDYNYYSAYSMIYIKLKDKDNSLKYIDKMLNSMKDGFSLEKSKLYKNVYTKKGEVGFNDKMLSLMISNLKSDESLEFLRDTKGFNEILDKYI